ncbi:MAG: alpha/beta fold hydrolase [Candidatus Thorarchaeota archaeon]|nr:MAG: alpha/beta fold hydrolase [Candidatus Thorarchaeota archaeon]
MSLAPKIKGIETRVEGANVAFLLVHGFCAAPDELETLREFLENRKIDSFSVQVAGHGTSPEDLKGTTWKDWYSSVEEGLNLVKSWKPKRLFVAGLSMGGVLSTLLASSNEGIDGLVLIAPALKVGGILPKLVPILKYFVKYREVDVETVQEQYDVKRTKYAREPVSAFHELFKMQKEALKNMSEISIPAIIIQGTDDKTIDPISGKLAFHGISSTDKQLFMIEGGEHVITCHHTREDAYPHIEEFVSRITRTT